MALSPAREVHKVTTNRIHFNNLSSEMFFFSFCKERTSFIKLHDPGSDIGAGHQTPSLGYKAVQKKKRPSN
jgi:hypothetical protein